MNSNMASERSAFMNPSSSCWSMIFSIRLLYKKNQTDLSVLVFSKAVDKVGHEKLALKLHGYGIRGSGPALKWVIYRHQSVIVSGSSSDPIPISSGVPQGSAGTSSLSNLHKWSSCECQIQSETLCRWHWPLSSPERSWQPWTLES